MECAEIRRKFIEYYQHLDFQLLPRAPMLHPSIPMSFVMSAGLVQVETSLANTPHRPGNKFVLVQNCFRHFDLERVGTDNIHLSLFEMPAAFVFGNNARQEVIQNIWKFVTDIAGIDPTRIWVSYFAGDEIHGHYQPEDRETYQAWRSVGVPPERMVGLNKQHNYWVQGGGIEKEHDSGLKKCGMNTELFYDLGESNACSSECKPGCRCGRFVEFSNTLFVSHHLDPESYTFSKMPDPFTETVIGCERVAMITQGVSSVFETTTYRPLIEAITQLASSQYLPHNVELISARVIADHLRALYVLIADGAPKPGKNGRERIIKQLVRGVITRHLILGIPLSERFPAKLSQQIARHFGGNQDDSAMNLIQQLENYIHAEQTRFLKTIASGERIMETMLKENQGEPLSGQQLVCLEKKWGLPFTLIEYKLQQKKIPCLTADYREALTAWKE